MEQLSTTPPSKRCQALFRFKTNQFVLMGLLVFVCSPGLFGKEKFPTKIIYVGSEKIKAEIAQTPEQQEQGLMFREKISMSEGMLFIFEDERPLSFWMKNTLIPLSIGFFDEKKKLLEVMDMEPASAVEQNPTVYNSKKPAMYALEVAKGWFKKKKIKPGVILKFEK